MAARGNIAKENVVDIISKAFGNNWIGEFNKKYYVWAQENGERVQIAISLTCPKTPVEIGNVENQGDYDFSDTSISMTNNTIRVEEPAEITQEERDRVEALMRALNL